MLAKDDEPAKGRRPREGTDVGLPYLEKTLSQERGVVDCLCLPSSIYSPWERQERFASFRGDSWISFRRAGALGHGVRVPAFLAKRQVVGAIEQESV